MFDNIGIKLQKLAVFATAIGIIVSFVYGLTLMGYSAIGGLIVIIGGGLISWVSSFVMYGFGELIIQAERSNDNAYVISMQLEKLINEKGTKAVAAQPQEASKQKVVLPSSDGGDTWTCHKCGTKNAKNVPYCKDCGTYK